MTYKTHLMIGLATVSTSILIMQITEIQHLTPLQFGASLAISIIASALPDIDSRKSKSREVANQLIGLLVIGLMIGIAYSVYKKIDLWKMETIKDTLSRFWAVFLLFFLLFAGTKANHRHMTHSILYCAVLTLLVYNMTGTKYLAAAFGLSMLSHDLADLLNKKKVQLFWPVKGGFCLNLFKADSTFSNMIRAIATIILAITGINNIILMAI